MKRRRRRPARETTAAFARSLQTDRTASVIIRGHALMQNFRRAHHELDAFAHPGLAVAAAPTSSQEQSEI